MREWRWRSYTDHLRDIGYDLDGGEAMADEGVPDAEPTPVRGRTSTVTR